MAKMSAMLTLLGGDLDDGWTGITTSAGGDAGITLIDAALYEKVADWVGDGMIVYLPLGPDGASAAETRVVSSLSGATLTPVTAFSAQVAQSVGYEVHRLFTRSQKLVALRNSAPLICPGIHAIVRDMSIETVEGQYEYAISQLAIYQNRPHQVLYAQYVIRDIWEAGTIYAKGDYVRPALLSTFTTLTYKCTAITGVGVSHADTEPTWPTTVEDTVVDNEVTWECQEDLDYSNYPMVPLHDWDVTPDGRLFLPAAYDPGYKLMIVGIKPLAFSGSGADETIALDSPFTLVLSAQAALYLCKQKVGSAGTQNIERWQQLVQSWTQELATRKAQYWMKPPDGTLITGPGLSV